MSSVFRASTRLRSVARLPAARALSTTASLRASEKPYFPNEPSAPSMSGPFPGPKNQAAAAKLDEVFDVRSLNMLTDYYSSVGN
jgi:4-aminobutyrate aminotransferase/(S)-3-amino-2-methylpropionate transaminase